MDNKNKSEAMVNSREDKKLYREGNEITEYYRD